MEAALVKLIQKETNLALSSVSNTIQLLEEGATIPFIARYRKEKTNSLSEVDIAAIQKAYEDLKLLVKRKETILTAIKDQGALSPELNKKIHGCWDKSTLEDIYLPFKKKIKTKSTIAKNNGLEPLAKIIMAQKSRDLNKDATGFVNKKVLSTELALEGARHIIAEWFSQDISIRDHLRKVFRTHGVIESKVVKSKKKLADKYESYFDFQEPLKNCPSHRLLAMFRGDKEGFLRVKLLIDEERIQHNLEQRRIRTLNSLSGQQLKLAIKDSLSRLIIPSIENEIIKEFKLKADKEAIQVFTQNLKELLLAPPLGQKRILAIDPGFRSGCKVVVLEDNGDLLHNINIYPHPPQTQVEAAVQELTKLIKKYQVKAMAIGNGTAGKETYQLVKAMKLDDEIQTYFVNENGASIYSASAIAREEFPDHDLTVRGAVSIGRRLMDPLAELVKIDPKSIGVGQYQHDVDQKLLKLSLDETISTCVNSVGINLNTASKSLLTHVSGLGPVLAENIINHRTAQGLFNSRKELLAVPRMGKKAFEQCAGFLRIKNGSNLLDKTGVHPEAYNLTLKMLKELKVKPETALGKEELLDTISLANYSSAKFGLPTLTDIISELKKPGLDPRGDAKPVSFSASINTISDLKIGMILNGVVNNVTKFGAFVDIGVKESGLVHISQITNRFIKDPAEIVSVNQEVTVKVLDIDVNKKRITLSMKAV